MEQKIVAVYGMISALNAEVEAMKIANEERKARGEAPAYNEGHFWEKADEIRNATNEIWK